MPVLMGRIPADFFLLQGQKNNDNTFSYYANILEIQEAVNGVVNRKA